MMINEYKELGIPENEYRKEFKNLNDKTITEITGLKKLRKGYFITR